MRELKFNLFNRKPPYTQDEISQQIGDISELMRQRDMSDPTEQEQDRITNHIEVAQEVLTYMLDEVRYWQKGQK